MGGAGEGSGSAAPERPGESALIARFFAPLASDAAARQLLDDAAVLTPPPGEDLVVTKDGLTAGVHFFADDPPEAIAAKALRVNLSDLAAKGARPLGYLMMVALPADWTIEWLAAFAAGLQRDQVSYGLSLYGGDTIRAGDGLTISITAFGAVPAGKAVDRRGARAGDLLYVSGTIGDAALGLRLRLDPGAAETWAIAADERDHLLDRYLFPRPRMALAPVLIAHADGAMDISDGLVGDLQKMCAASGIGAEIAAADVPLSPAAAKAVAADPALGELMLTGGDDYEILAAVAPSRAGAFEAAAAAVGIAVTRIGALSAGAGVTVRDVRGERLAFGRASYDHFRGKEKP